MKKLLILLFVSFISFAQAQTLTEQVDNTIRGKTYNPTNAANMFQALIDSLHLYELIPYVNPVFNSFAVTGQSSTVEVGTTLTGSKTFTWSISPNSGVVPTIDIYDITGAVTLLGNTLNDGSHVVAVSTIQLNANGSTQQWRGVGNNTSPAGTFNSSTVTVTSRYYRFSDPVATTPTNSAQIRALSSAFVTGAGSFTLPTGATETEFFVALPPGRSITSVVDETALGANITSQYVLQSSINVTDAGGTNSAYVIYKMNIGAPYAVSHDHLITFN